MKESMDDCKTSPEINATSFKEWMTVTFFMRETNNLLQRWMNATRFQIIPKITPK